MTSLVSTPTVDQLISGGNVQAIAFSGNTYRCAIALDGGIVHVFKRVATRWIHFGSAHGSAYSKEMSWSHDGSTLGWISNEEAKIWKPGYGLPAEIHIPKRTEYLDRLALSPNGKTFAASTEYLMSWGRVSMKAIDHKIKTGPTALSLLFVNNNTLYAGGESLTRYSLPSGSKRVIAKKTDFVDRLLLDTAKKHVAVLTFGTSLEVRSAPDGRLERKLDRRKGSPASVAWSGDGRYIACELAANFKEGEPSWYNRIQVFDTTTGKRVAQHALKEAEIGHIIFDPYGTKIYMFRDGLWGTWKFKK